MVLNVCIIFRRIIAPTQSIILSQAYELMKCNVGNNCMNNNGDKSNNQARVIWNIYINMFMSGMWAH